MSGGYRSGMGDRPGGWAGQAIVKRSNAPNGMEVGIDFPFVCETCLGPNPYVRMVKMPPGDKLCKISNRGFQSFRWRAGPGGRWKETMIEYTVAKDKNLCQACLVDMTFGVPAGVRDALLAAGVDPTAQSSAVTSDPNAAYYWAQKDAANASAAQGGQLQHMQPSRQLLHLARSIHNQEKKQVTAWRNLPKLCSFWLNGTCSRVVQKKCPFRPCNGMFEFPEIASSNREMRIELIDRLKKEGPVEVMRTLDPQVREALHGAGKGNKEDAIKKRYSGNDDLSKRYLRRAREAAPNLEAPKDTSIMSLWIGGVEAPPITEQDIRDIFYSYGEIRAVRLLAAKRCAFVEYTSRAAAEAAATALHRNLTIKELKLDLDWAKPASHLASGSSTPYMLSDPNSGSIVLPPPPSGVVSGAAPFVLSPDIQARLQATMMLKSASTEQAPPAKRSRTESTVVLNSEGPQPHYESMSANRLGGPKYGGN